MRIIDADALMNAHIECPEHISFFDFGEMVELFLQTVDEQPTIDAVPVVHGEWILSHEDVDGSPFTGERCSICDWWKSMGVYNYCPNCGAKMDGKENNNEQRI